MSAEQGSGFRASFPLRCLPPCMSEEEAHRAGDQPDPPQRRIKAHTRDRHNRPARRNNIHHRAACPQKPSVCSCLLLRYLPRIADRIPRALPALRPPFSFLFQTLHALLANKLQFIIHNSQFIISTIIPTQSLPDQFRIPHSEFRIPKNSAPSAGFTRQSERCFSFSCGSQRCAFRQRPSAPFPSPW